MHPLKDDAPYICLPRSTRASYSFYHTIEPHEEIIFEAAPYIYAQYPKGNAPSLDSPNPIRISRLRQTGKR